MAGHDIAIETARNTVTESHSSHTKKFGLFGTGGVGFTIGTQTRENTADIDEQFHTGSLIGSTEGRVDIVAGGDVAIAGSDVLSKAGIGITGENVAITAVENSLSVVEAQKFRQAGLNVSLKGGVVDTAMAVYGAAKRSEEVEDDRLKALYAAQAGQTLFSGGQAGLNSFATTGQQFGELANTNTDTKASGNSGLSLRIGIGASKSDSKQTYTEATAEGSRIASEGDVAIIARSGDVTVTGSRIEGDNVALAAARDLILQSAEESSELRARNQSSSGEIGITIGTEAGIGVYVSASMAKGEGNGNGTTHAETTVEAADTLTLISGRDTTLEGAQAIGETVIANVGRHLTLTSQQDSNDYDREDMSAGIDVAVGMGGATVSGYYNQSDIESTYTSVNEQTGIQAGAGGFNIEVGGHTELTGAAIASTADPGLNRLSAESLSVSDLYNEAAYEATSFGVSASGGSGGGSFSPNIAPSQSEESDSTTRAGISAGVVDIRNGDRSALDDVDRSVTELQQSGLKDIFDEQEVREGQEFAAGLSTLATQIVDDIYSAKLADKQAEIDAVEAAAGEATARGDTALAGELYEQVAYMRDQRDEGYGVVVAKSIVGVAVSALAGNVSLESGLTHSAVNSGIAVWDDAANKAMRGHDETVAIKVACNKTAQECADLRIPDGLSMEQRIDYLRDNGMTIEFVSEIPAGAGNIAVNGILNDQARAAQVQIGHVERNDGKAEGTTYYVQYNASKGGISDLIQAAYDKFVSPVNSDYSATTVALVNAISRQGDSPTNLFAHSWGTIVTRNTLNLLVDAEYNNASFTVAAFGPAVRPGALFDPMEQIVGEDRLFPTMENEKPALYYFSSPNDPVATFVGGTIWLWPSSHLDSNSPLHLPGGAPGSVWGATKGWVPVIKGPENDHSCYGLNCQGTPYNWTEQEAAKYKKEEEGEPAIGGGR